MRNFKRFLSLAVAALLSVSAVATSASAAKFTDVEASNEALTDAVELLVALGVTKGTSDTEFGTAQNVTREQMAAFIYRMMKAGKSVEGGTNTTSFTDLEDPTFFFMVSWASSQGIIKGRSATAFDPKGGITLQDAYTMIVRALGYDDGTLAYPIGYISWAEDLGLDENLPSTLNYTDTLTRGDVAIILANMFYAETAEVEIKYESSWKEVELSDGSYAVVSNGQVPKEYHKTVAEAIFEVEKVSQRVVATPSHSFEDEEKPDEDVEMITLSADYVIDYEDYDTDIESLGQIEFAELGLEGKADDYFLTDIVMFVKDTNDGYEVFGATAAGTKTTVSFDKVDFGTVNGTTIDKYYDGEEKEYKIINGLLTIDGVKTYLFDAPYSYAKDQDTDKYNAQFITLGEFDGDIEEGDVFVNYVIDEVAADADIVGTYDDDEGWTYDGYLSQLYFDGLGEIDCYDCDGDGRYDYLFVKNYTVGTINDEEDADMYGHTYYDATAEAESEDAMIYTDLSIVEGVEFEDEDVVLAYVNKEANYVKVIEVLEGAEASIATSATKYFALSTGEKIYYANAKAVVLNGAANLVAVDADAEVDFDSEATYYFAGGKLVYVTGLATAINVNENYVIVLDEEVFTTTSLVDGKLVKADYIDIYNDGEIKSVQAKKVSEDSSVYDAKETPATYDIDNDEWIGFGDYVNKLATGKSDKKGAYYFELVDFTDEDKTDITALLDKEDENAEYRATDVTTKFFKKSGYIYDLVDATEDSKMKGVYIKPYTQIIIRTVDKDDEEIVVTYGYDNLPNWDEDTTFKNVSYVLLNNINSTSYENLVVFYGTTGLIDDAIGEVAELRVIKTFTRTSTEDGTLITYDVFNPFTGKVETGIDGAATDVTTAPNRGDIFGLTTDGYIDDDYGMVGNAFTAGSFYDVEDDFDELSGLGYLAVAEYDETTGYLELGQRKVSGDDIIVDNILPELFVISDETVVSFADLSEETIKTVDASTLASTSKAYRNGELKEEPIRVFVCAELDDDDDDESFYNVTFAMIVRD